MQHLKEATEAALGILRPISLNALGSLSLMNRVEIKYLLSFHKVPDLINLLAGQYHTLEIDNKRSFPYSSVYMDTADSLFYNQHVRGKLDRYKIRYRKYDSTNCTFLEVKRKTNKGRTVKWRIERNPDESLLDPQATEFLGKYSPVSADLIKPVLLNRFTRITLAGLDLKERVTIDFNITFSDFNGNAGLSFPWLAIVELKKESYSDSSYFRNLIKIVNAHPSAFSKYCIGRCLLNDSLKKNILKPKLILLKKLENEYT